MRFSAPSLALISALLLAAPAPLAFAAGGGGGGGGGGFSSSSPQYDPAVEYQNGVTQLQAKDYRKAIRSFRRVIAIDKRNANAHYLLGSSYFGQSKYKKAVKSFQKAVKYNANLIPAHRDLAISHFKLGKSADGQASLAQLRGKLSNCSEPCSQKAELEQAIKAAEQASEGQEISKLLRPDWNFGDRTAHDGAYLQAVALINEERFEEAITQLTQTAKSAGSHPDILTYLGFAHRKLKQYAVAERYYQRALTIAPAHLGALEYYGELKLERGDREGAKRHLAKLDALCTFGCYEADELRKWLKEAQS